ncbi:hypothetical protein J2X67_001354 [Variovorax sp. 3319]|nr:hypothetical protein [Variovorax sp. 3319]
MSMDRNVSLDWVIVSSVLKSQASMASKTGLKYADRVPSSDAARRVPFLTALCLQVFLAVRSLGIGGSQVLCLSRSDAYEALREGAARSLADSASAKVPTRRPRRLVQNRLILSPQQSPFRCRRIRSNDSLEKYRQRRPQAVAEGRQCHHRRIDVASFEFGYPRPLDLRVVGQGHLCLASGKSQLL